MYKGVEVELQALRTSVLDEGEFSSPSGPSSPEGKDSTIQWAEHWGGVDPVDWTQSGIPGMILILGVCILFRVWDQGESVFRLRNFNIVGSLYLF
jgi:hypothetical protein